MTDWETCLAKWRVHAKLQRFAHKRAEAVAIAQEGARRGRLFGALSGGKDGVAMAGILEEAGLGFVPLCHAYCDLHTPGMDAVAVETAQRLGMRLQMVEPDVDVWALLESLPRDVPANEAEPLYRAIAAGNMLVQYAYEAGFDGAFSGMRAEENTKTRGRLFRARGPIYQYATDGQWMCCPLAWWSADDVFAYAVERALPIHDHYRRFVEAFGEPPDRARVDCVIVRSRIASKGAATVTKRLYPELWRRITRIRPELERDA